MHKLMITKREVVSRLRSLREEAREDGYGPGMVRLSVWRADDCFGVADYWDVTWEGPHCGESDAEAHAVVDGKTTVRELEQMAGEMLRKAEKMLA
jgi:hypothetical protein